LVWQFVRLQVARLGQDRVVDIFAWALLCGAVLQGLVCVFQFIGHTAWLPGMMRAPQKYFVFGQVGQRNHLGHYMMWGVLALGYLWSRRRLPGLIALALAVFLLQVIGVITSRTIMVYVGALLLLVPLLYVLGGRPLRRWCALTGLLVLGVLAAQLIMPWLVDTWLAPDVQSSGVGRLVSGDAASPGRSSEWAKAWTVFIEHPWLGVGWQGYAHESFALAMRGSAFRNYDVGVLFTHSHNSMLEILAEMGVVGAILVFGGWLAVATGYLKKGLGASSALMLALMSVSLCHSLLEYPLWYVYFLTPFVVMMSLTPAKAPGWYIVQAGKWPQRFGMAFAALAAAIIVQYGFAYHRLVFAYANPTENYPQYKQVDTLRELESKHYFLKYYAQMGLIRKVDWLRPLPEWGRDAALRASRNGRILVIDSEGGLKADALERLGVDPDRVVVLSPPMGGSLDYETLDAAFHQVKTDLAADPESWYAVVIDSLTELVAALAQRAEALLERLDELRRLRAQVDEEHALAIFDYEILRQEADLAWTRSLLKESRH